jgi:hypothetical protein
MILSYIKMQVDNFLNDNIRDRIFIIKLPVLEFYSGLINY